LLDSENVDKYAWDVNGLEDSLAKAQELIDINTENLFKGQVNFCISGQLAE
jgi:hypothetical protein